jgi:hypothetical protein
MSTRISLAGLTAALVLLPAGPDGMRRQLAGGSGPGVCEVVRRRRGVRSRGESLRAAAELG